MNKKLLSLSGTKSLLRKEELDSLDSILKKNLKTPLGSFITSKNINLGKVTYSIPVLVFKKVDKVLSSERIGTLVSLREKKISKYSLINSKAVTEIDNLFFFNHELKRLDSLINSIKSCNFKNQESAIKPFSFEINSLENTSKKVIVEINKGSYFKKEITQLKLNSKDLILISQLDRVQPTTHKFPYSYGSIVGLPSYDGDYADCFIISKEGFLREGKRISLKRKELNLTSGIEFKVRNQEFFLSAIMETKDQSGEDPKLIFSQMGVNIDEAVELIDSCYSKWKKKNYSLIRIIKDPQECRNFYNKLNKKK